MPMFLFICRTLINHRAKHSTLTTVRFLQTQSISNNSNLPQKQSFTVSYLTESCGLSLESAISASKVLQIKTTKKSDSVLELLRSHGCSRNHIASLISKNPRLILADPEKNLRPKMEFFESVGIVGPELPRILCSCKEMLRRSLNKQIIPTFNFLRSYLKTNENLLNALKASSFVVSCNIQKVMLPNIETLRAHGVPESHIGKLIMLQPKSLMLRVDLFKEVANAVKEMGCDPTSLKFILAVRSMSFATKPFWEKKKEAFMSFGCTESNFNSAFKVQPMFMLHSEKKIREMMDYFVNKVGLKPSDVARCPNVILTSLERRIIPRHSVLQVLKSKGLIKENLDLVWVFNEAKVNFETKYVTKYIDVAPEVVKAYQVEAEFQVFNNA